MTGILTDLNRIQKTCVIKIFRSPVFFGDRKHENLGRFESHPKKQVSSNPTKYPGGFSQNFLTWRFFEDFSIKSGGHENDS